MARNCDVLLIEDNPGDAKLVELMLADLCNSTSRYSVNHQATLADALEAAASHHFDVVLLDLSLPDATGIDCLEAVRECMADTPVILVTGRGSESLAVEAMKTGAADYLSKNDLASDVLHRTIHSALEHAEYRRKVQELETFKANIVATASHELRTPLAIIREYVALVRDGIPGPVNGDQTECLDGALRNCDRLASLINDTLDLHRLEHRSVSLRRSRTDLWALLDECTRDFEAQFAKKRQELTVSLPDDLPAVLADGDQISQVIVNLIGNAHKFTPAGGKVSVSVTARTNDVVVRIADTGPGIDKDDQERIFEPFAQINRMDAPGAQGTGLGLAICRRIVDAHEGSLTVRSELGEGSTFSVSIPVYAERSEMIALLSDQSEAAAQHSRRIGYVAIRVRPLGATDDPRNLLQETASIVTSTLRRSDDVTAVSQDLRIVLAAGQIEKPDSPGLCMRVERAVLDTLGDTVPLDFASGEVGVSDDIEACFDSMVFSPSTRLPTKAVVIGPPDGTAQRACRELATLGGSLEVIAVEEIYEGLLVIGRVQPNLVLIDAAIPAAQINAVAENGRIRGHNCPVFVLSDGSEHTTLADDLSFAQPSDVVRIINQLAGMSQNRRWEPNPRTPRRLPPVGAFQ